MPPHGQVSPSLQVIPHVLASAHRKTERRRKSIGKLCSREIGFNHTLGNFEVHDEAASFHGIGSDNSLVFSDRAIVTPCVVVVQDSVNSFIELQHESVFSPVKDGAVRMQAQIDYNAYSCGLDLGEDNVLLFMSPPSPSLPG